MNELPSRIGKWIIEGCIYDPEHRKYLCTCTCTMCGRTKYIEKYKLSIIGACDCRKEMPRVNPKTIEKEIIGFIGKHPTGVMLREISDAYPQYNIYDLMGVLNMHLKNGLDAKRIGKTNRKMWMVM